jgi:hypothetical protein
MKLRILPSALEDLTRGRLFYARLDQGLGEYFLDSHVGDIDSLAHHAGSHQKVFGYHRLLDCGQDPARTLRALIDI